ncbi:hypothetical protein LguiB_017027 [Lonicera macranthoides]
MAPVLSSLYSQSLTLRPPPPLVPYYSSFTSLPQFHLQKGSGSGSTKNTNPSLICCNHIQEYHNSHGVENEEGCQSKRRDVVFKTAFAAFSFSFPSFVPFTFAADTDVLEEFRVYTDDVNKFKITIPQDWQVGLGDGNGIKSVTAFYPKEVSNSNVSIVITGLGPDFTRLESFGKVDSFAENLVSGLDRSWQRPPGVAAKLIDSKAANGLYYIEYSLQNPGGSRRYLYSVLGMANNGWYNRLYTLTGQFVEEEADKYSSKIAKAVATFRLTT